MSQDNQKKVVIGYIQTAILTFNRLDVRVDLGMNLPVFSYTNYMSKDGFFHTESVLFPKWDFVDFTDDRVTLEVLDAIWKILEQKLEMVFSRIMEDEEKARKAKELKDRISLELRVTLDNKWKES